MYTRNEFTRMVDELAGHWTDSALEILKDADIRPISVDIEVETWHTLKKVLHAELRWQRAFRISTRMSLSALMEQVLRKATLVLARKFAPLLVSAPFEVRIRQLAGERRATAVERNLYAEIIRHPVLRNAFKPPSRTDFTPRLRVSAFG